MQLTLIYTDSHFLLSKKTYSSWRDVQDEYPDYKTSLGPWSVEEVVEYLSEEYPSLHPSANEQVSNFLADVAAVKILTFV